MKQSLYAVSRAGLFALDAERAHTLTIGLLSRFPGLLSVYGRAPVVQPTSVMGLEFRNRVGLAAGLDKNAECLAAWEKLGFGFIEVGTVTPRPQPGNPKPRMFRIPDAGAIINRLGFNSLGVDAVVANLERGGFHGVLGVNIGKNADTPLEDAHQDYLQCLDAVQAFADYVTVNLSSPNTEGLRDLQFGDSMSSLLGQLAERRDELAAASGRRLPLAVKLAPDLSGDQCTEAARRIRESGFDAVIATNTTVSRPLDPQLPHATEAGGLSGAPLQSMADQVLKSLRAELGPDLPIIGVGGIMSAADARRKIDCGANLVQLYTGFIYHGPALVHAAIRQLG